MTTFVRQWEPFSFPNLNLNDIKGFFISLFLDALGSDFMESISDVSSKSEDTQIQEDEDKSNGWDTFGILVMH